MMDLYPAFRVVDDDHENCYDDFSHAKTFLKDLFTASAIYHNSSKTTKLAVDTSKLNPQAIPTANILVTSAFQQPEIFAACYEQLNIDKGVVSTPSLAINNNYTPFILHLFISNCHTKNEISYNCISDGQTMKVTITEELISVDDLYDDEVYHHYSFKPSDGYIDYDNALDRASNSGKHTND